MAVQVVAVAWVDVGTGTRSEAMNMGPKLGRLSLIPPFFCWSATDKYAELRKFRYELSNADKVLIIKNWLDREGLQLWAHTQTEQKAGKTVEGNFCTLNGEFVLATTL